MNNDLKTSENKTSNSRIQEKCLTFQFFDDFCNYSWPLSNMEFSNKREKPGLIFSKTKNWYYITYPDLIIKNERIHRLKDTAIWNCFWANKETCFATLALLWSLFFVHNSFKYNNKKDYGFRDLLFKFFSVSLHQIQKGVISNFSKPFLVSFWPAVWVIFCVSKGWYLLWKATITWSIKNWK